MPAIDRIEKHDDFSPITRSSREPTRVDRIWSGTVIGKEGNLSGIINCSRLHIKIRPTNRRRIGHLDIPFINLVRANDDAAVGDATAHDRAEGNLIRVINIRDGTTGNKSSVLEPEALNAEATIRSAARSRITKCGYLCDHAVVPHE